MKNRALKGLKRIICFIFILSLLCPSVPFLIVYASDDEATPIEQNNNQLDWSLDDCFPALKHQAETSCAAWATAYYQYSFQVALNRKKNNESGYNDSVFSPDYMFNYLNFKYTNEGLTLDDCYDFLKKQGCIEYSAFYGEDSEPYSWYGADGDSDALNNMRNALQYKVVDSYPVTIPNGTNNTFITNSDDPDLYDVKRLLNEGYVLAISTPTENNKELVGGMQVLVDSYHSLKDNGEIKNTFHAIIIVGYDDNFYYDINGNGEREIGEYGAFIVVDSFVSHDCTTNNENHSGRKYMMMYDSLNTVSVYKNAKYNTQRAGSIKNNKCWYIDVKENTPSITVEVTIEQKYRNDFTISLGNSATSTIASSSYKKTFVDKIGGDRSFSGITNPTEKETYTFVFDYSSYCSTSEKYYGVKVTDSNTHTDSTKVKKIVWKDSNGVVIKTTP